MPLPAASAASDFATFIVVVLVVTLIIAGVAFARSGSAWRSIGRGPLAIDDEPPPGPPPAGAPPEVRRADQAEELRAEVRQLVVAGNERRARQGLGPLDVGAETERQLADLAGG